jgi:hypothetical protein
MHILSSSFDFSVITRSEVTRRLFSKRSTGRLVYLEYSLRARLLSTGSNTSENRRLILWRIRDTASIDCALKFE